VYPVRHTDFSQPNISPAANAALSPALTGGGLAIPVGPSPGIVADECGHAQDGMRASSNALSKDGYAAFP